MLTEAQTDFLSNALTAARASGHIFPEAAACEAAVETAWGTSQLYLRGNNVFGQKVPLHPNPAYGVLAMPTQENLNGKWVTIQANFVHFPTIAESFHDRMATLVRLAPSFIHYHNALEAPSPEVFLFEVSRTWATDPDRSRKCILILHNHRDILYSKLDEGGTSVSQSATPVTATPELKEV